MFVTHHAVSGKAASRIRAYGLDPAVVEGTFRALKERPTAPVGVVLARSDHQVKAGGATGRYLVAIIRRGRVVTIVNSHSTAAAHLRVSAVQWAV